MNYFKKIRSQSSKNSSLRKTVLKEINFEMNLFDEDASYDSFLEYFAS
jgi:hypothetical protein